MTANFSSASTIPVTAASYTATGNTVSLSLGFTPPTGTDLMVVKNTGLPFISGKFTNLAQGQEVSLNFNGIGYKFIANYYGGSGNDLILHWKRRAVCAWGFNAWGQLGDTLTTRQNMPVSVFAGGVLADKSVIAVYGGSEHSIALASDGTVATWGNNATGELGRGNTVKSSVPVLVDTNGVLAGKTIVAVAAGRSFSIALVSDGTVATWGANSYGQLGNGITTSSNVPVLVNTAGALSGKTVVAVAAGDNHCLALCSDGTVVGWGGNSNGQLGNNTIINSSVPVLVDTGGVLFGKTVQAISAGGDFSVALCSDGKMAAWGYGTYSQLGNGSNVDSSVPVAVLSAGALLGKVVVSVSAGYYHTLALCSDGTLVAWGYNGKGQLGDNTNVSSNTPVFVNTAGALSGKTVTSVSAGGALSLASCSDGSAASWGSDSYGTAGSGSVNSSVPVRVNDSNALAGRKLRAISAGGYHSLAICGIPMSSKLQSLAISTGTLTPPFSPDNKSYSTTMNSNSLVSVTPTARDSSLVKVNGITVESGTSSDPILLNAGSKLIRIEVAGEGGELSVYTISTLFGNSLNADFAAAGDVPLVGDGIDLGALQVNLSLGFAPPLGTNLTVFRNTGADSIKGEFVNLSHGQTVELNYEGKIYRFLANYRGGNGNDLVLEWPNRSIASWGENSNGQIGDATLISKSLPVATFRNGVLQGKTVSLISASISNLALCVDGTLVAWGANSAGTLGLGSVTQSSVPAGLTGMGVLSGKQVISVAVGSGTAVAVCSDGSLAAWGYNAQGQVGDGTTTNRNTPVAVLPRGALVGKKAVAVAVGGLHCIALCSDGTVVSWGSNSSGQLGNGNTTGLVTDPPVSVLTTGVLAGRKVVAIGAGFDHNLALCSDGTLVSWGGGTGGGSSPVAVYVSGVLTDRTVTAISVSAVNSAVLCSDGTVAAWGQSADGQLGNGTLVTSYNPVAIDKTGVLAGKTVISVSVGDGCMFATCSDGTLAAWGRNSSGQLGDGTAIRRTLPVLVNSSGELYGKKVLAVASGGGQGHTHAILAEPDSGYIAWMSGRAGVPNKMLSGDPDQDGISNLMEYVLNGDPGISSTTILPTTTDEGADFVFHFNRLATSAGDSTQVFQYSTDMSQWTGVKITTPVDAGVAFGAVDSNGSQSVSVTVPKGAGTRMFGRLQVVRP